MDTVLRVLIIYVFLLLAMRQLGKREFGQLSPMELVSLLLIPEILSQAINRGDASLINGLVGVTTLLGLVFLTSVLMQKSPRAEKFISGEPVVLAHQGRFVREHLECERVTPDEVYTEMRKAGFERLADVRWAILESDGKISFIPAEGREGTPSQAPEGGKPGAGS